MSLSWPWASGAPSSPPVRRPRVALDDVVRRSLAPVALTLAGLYGLLSIAHGLVLPPSMAWIMAGAALVTALALAGFGLWWRYRPPSRPWVYPAAFAVALGSLGNSLLHLYLSGEPQQTTNLMLLMIAAGLFLLHSRWFLLLLLLTVAGWSLLVWQLGPSPLWLHYGFALLQSVVVAVLLHRVFAKSLKRLKAARLTERRHNIELRRALAEAEQARLTLEASQRDLRLAKDRAEAGDRAKSQFLANMSHELRTPLNAVIGMTGLLLDTPLTAEQKDVAATIRHSSEALLAVISDILDFSKLDAGQMELESRPFALERCARKALNLVAHQAAGKGLTLELKLAPELPRQIVGDPPRLRQVLLNLLGNAVKFTHQGGVTLAVGGHIEADGCWRLRFTVTDTGIGIPSQRQNRLFRAFSQVDASTTRRYGGSGLGLVISRHLVELMGGELGVESGEGQGSTFWFTVLATPAAVESPADGPAPESGFDGELGRRHPLAILVVEDHPVNQKVALAILKRLGYRADLADDGLAAIQALERKDYDLVLMDVQMPILDGLEATRRIRARLPAERQPWIVALTANATAADRAQCLAAGMDGYLSKPIRLDRLLVVLKGCRSPVAGTPVAGTPAQTPS